MNASRASAGVMWPALTQFKAFVAIRRQGPPFAGQFSLSRHFTAWRTVLTFRDRRGLPKSILTGLSNSIRRMWHQRLSPPIVSEGSILTFDLSQIAAWALYEPSSSALAAGLASLRREPRTTASSRRSDEEGLMSEEGCRWVNPHAGCLHGGDERDTGVFDAGHAHVGVGAMAHRVNPLLAIVIGPIVEQEIRRVSDGSDQIETSGRIGKDNYGGVELFCIHPL